MPRMQALKKVTESNGVTHMAAICAICKSQFAKVMPYYGFEMDGIVSIHQLVSNALILDGQDTGETADGDDNSGEEPGEAPAQETAEDSEPPEEHSEAQGT